MFKEQEKEENRIIEDWKLKFGKLLARLCALMHKFVFRCIDSPLLLEYRGLELSQTRVAFTISLINSSSVDLAGSEAASNLWKITSRDDMMRARSFKVSRRNRWQPMTQFSKIMRVQFNLRYTRSGYRTLDTLDTLERVSLAIFDYSIKWHDWSQRTTRPVYAKRTKRINVMTRAHLLSESIRNTRSFTLEIGGGSTLGLPSRAPDSQQS